MKQCPTSLRRRSELNGDLKWLMAADLQKGRQKHSQYGEIWVILCIWVHTTRIFASGQRDLPRLQY